MDLSGDIEISAARSDELETMLRIICPAFELPYASVRQVFFHDPFFRLENKRVLRVHGRVVSCLNLVERVCRIGAAAVPLAGLAGVATRPEERCRGYASGLLLETVREVAARGIGFVGLFPSTPSFYRKLGWEVASTEYRCSVPLAALPRYSPDRRIRTLCAADIPRLQALSEAASRGHALYCQRDSSRWEAILGDVRQKVGSESSGGELTGYLLYEYRPGLFKQIAPAIMMPPTIRILELAAPAPSAARGLIGHLARQIHAESVEYTATLDQVRASGLNDLWSFGEDDEALGAVVETVPGLMIRLADPLMAVRAIAPNWTGFAGSLGLLVRDAALNSESRILVSGSNGPSVSGVSDVRGLPSDLVEGDAAVWARVLVGHLSAGEAIALRQLRASSAGAAEMAEQIFPSRRPFLPALEHF